MDSNRLSEDRQGDELNFTLTLDLDSENISRLLAPETNVFSLNSIEEPSNALELPKPVAGTGANWLSKGNNEACDNAILERMKSLAV